jgi:glycoside/pentoside/hexuronide:cation symporter, GPH family
VSRADPQQRLSAWRLSAYGLASIPLAMAALPIYVNVPKFYSDVIGLNLIAIGGLLLAARIFDAIQDPLLGYWSDLMRDSKWGRHIWLLAGTPLLAVSMLGLFNPPQLSQGMMMWWLVAMLLTVYTAFSMIQISYQAVGAELSDDKVDRTRVTSFREGFGLIGVFLAAALPQVLTQQYGAREGYAIFALAFIPLIFLFVGLTVWLSPKPVSRTQAVTKNALTNILLPLKNLHFKRLMVVFVFNGIAASIPATLVLFFIEDVIKAPQYSAQFLIAYFAAGAAGMPLWIWLSGRIGKSRAWFVGMIVSIIAFVWAYTLGAGDIAAFMVICVLSGLGLGADLSLPPSILADVIDEDDKRGLGRNEGAYFGLWNLVSKMNLALAAGIALPALALLGYVPGASSAESAASLTYLALIYALLPCALKAIAAVALIYTPFFKSK